MTPLALARRVASTVPDPELPALTLGDLGILRDVVVRDGRVEVTITPTYTGCPALVEIREDLRHRLQAAGFPEVSVRTELSPPWTSDWVTDEGRRKLRAAGISPPRRPASPRMVPLGLRPRDPVPCPRCGSTDTVQTAAFGATACKALHRCRSCAEPFEYLKDI